MKRHLKVLTAIAVATLAVLVVVMQIGPAKDQLDSTEARQALDERRSERFEETRTARQDARARSGGAKNLDQLKKQLLREFPNLRADPPIPNEDNPIFLLNELVVQLADQEEVLINDLLSVMGEGVEWDLEAAQAVLSRYKPLLGQLNAMAGMSRGSFYDEEGGPLLLPLDTLATLLELERLQFRIEVGTGKLFHVLNNYSFNPFASLIRRSDHSSFIHDMIVERHRQRPLAAPMSKTFYDQMLGPALYGKFASGWHMPNWAENLSQESLSKEIRRVWWDEIYDGYPNPFDPLGHDSRLQIDTDLQIARAYAAYTSEILTRLETQGLRDFVVTEFPALQAEGLSDMQKKYAEEKASELQDYLMQVFAFASMQHQQQTAINLRALERKGGVITQDTLDRIPPEPLGGQRYIYDPETRILSLPDPAKSYAPGHLQLNKSDTGDLWDIGRVAWDPSELRNFGNAEDIEDILNGSGEIGQPTE